MLLKLLMFWALWVTTVHGQDLNCLHDGYLDNSPNCYCNPGYSGAQCQTRVPFNDGTLRKIPGLTAPLVDQGTICPPGFIGANCQPTKCVSGNSQTFYSNEEDQMVSMYITYNKILQDSNYLLNDTVITTIFEQYNSSLLKQLAFSLGSTLVKQTLVSRQNSDDPSTMFHRYLNVTCSKLDDDNKIIGYESCPGSDSFSIDVVANIVDFSLPNSEIYVITNYPMNDTDIQKLPWIIRKAVSKKLRIHAIAFPIPVMSNVDFINEAGYQALRTLAESTLGVFVTPINGISNLKMGSSSTIDVINELMKMKKGKIVPVAVFSTADGLKTVNFTTGPYYISIRNEQPVDPPVPNPLNFNSSSCSWNNINSSKIDTGYWKLYKYENPCSSLTIFDTTLSIPVNYVIYAKSDSVYTAVLNTLKNDADSPFGSLGNSQYLVASASSLNIKSAEVQKPVLSFNGTMGVFNWSTINPQPRPNCQFNIQIGSINCATEGVVFLTIKMDDTSFATPIFCTGPNSIKNLQIPSNTIEELDAFTNDLSFDAACTTKYSGPSLYEGSFKRTFAIVSRNVRNFDPSKPFICYENSTVDSLYYNPNNIFDYLQKLDNTTYDYYFANLLAENPRGNQIIAKQGLQTFMDTLLSTTAFCDENRNTIFDWMKELSITIQKIQSMKTVSYSDVFVVIDSDKITGFLNTDVSASYDLFKSIYSTRSRIFFLAVDYFNQFQPDNVAVQKLSTVAAQSGGGLYRFKTFSDLKEFFDVYFDQTGNGLLNADIVYQKIYTSNISNFKTDIINFPSTLNGQNVNYWLQLYGTQPPTVFVDNCSGTELNASFQFNEQWRYDLNSLANTSRSFCIQYKSSPSLEVSMVIYTTSAKKFTTYANVAFTNSPSNVLSPTAALLNFGSTAGIQFPTISTYLQSVSIKTSTSLEIISNESTNITNSTCNTSDFKTIFNYNFICTLPNQFYYFYMTFYDNQTNLHTRTYVTQCLSSGDQQCLNGQSISKTCQCDVGFTGPICETPICQNGGTATPAQLCNCPDGYSGKFCENANNYNCSNAARPDIRSEVSSVLFVVDKAVNLLTTTSDFPNTLPGIQLTVVQYDCSGVKTALLGTDPTKLSAQLIQTANTSCTTSSGNIENAIIQAMDTQISNRALLVLITDGNFTYGGGKQEILNRLSKQRVDIRIFSTGTPTDNLKNLATLGNGIVFQENSGHFSSYCTNYIWKVIPSSLLMSSDNAQKIPRLSVIQTGSGPANLILQSDAVDSSSTYTVYYIHTSNNVNVTGLIAVQTINGTTTKIFAYRYFNASNVIIQINGKDPYSIEKMTTVSLGYGFQTNKFDDNLQAGINFGSSFYMSFYTSRSYNSIDASGTYPYIALQEIKMNGTLYPSKLPVNKKNCVYPYYSASFNCNFDTVAFIAQFVTYSNQNYAQRLEQKVIACGAVPIPNRNFAFVIDTRGNDPNLFTMTRNAVLQFLGGFDSSTFIFFTDQNGNGSANIGKGSFISNTVNNINNAFNLFRDYRVVIADGTWSDPTSGLQAITKAYSSSSRSNDPLTTFYLTQTGIKNETSPDLPVFTSGNISCIFFIQNGNQEAAIKSVSNYIPKMSVTNNTLDAVNFMASQSAASPAIAPTTRPYACVKHVQASIIVGFEGGNLTADPSNNLTMNKIYNDFFNMFPSDFEVGDVNLPGDGCSNYASRLEGVSQFTALNYYDSKTLGYTLSFCMNNYPSDEGYAALLNKARTPSPDFSKLILLQQALNNPCICSRANDNSTLKIMIWNAISLPDVSQTANLPSYTTNNNFIHIVIAYLNATNSGAGNFYYEIANSSISKMISYPGYSTDLAIDDFFIKYTDYNSTTLVIQKLWGTICKLQGIIGGNDTTIPPVSQSTEYFDKYWRAQALLETKYSDQYVS